MVKMTNVNPTDVLYDRAEENELRARYSEALETIESLRADLDAAHASLAKAERELDFQRSMATPIHPYTGPSYLFTRGKP